LLFGCG
jgi:hypothetical protein